MNTRKAQTKARYSRRRLLADREPKEGMDGTTGYLYVFRSGKSDLYKIGFSGDWQKRLTTLQASNPALFCLRVRRVENVRKVEKELHEKFESQRYTREYFKLTQDDIKFIDEYLDVRTPAGYSPQQKAG